MLSFTLVSELINTSISYSTFDFLSVIFLTATNEHSKHFSNLLGISINACLDIILVQRLELTEQPQLLNLPCESQDVFTSAYLEICQSLSLMFVLVLLECHLSTKTFITLQNRKWKGKRE